jgi:hypothetical protein
VITAAVGLGAMEAVGGAVLAPRGKKAHEAVQAAADGPVDATLRAIVVDRAAFGASRRRRAGDCTAALSSGRCRRGVSPAR